MMTPVLLLVGLRFRSLALVLELITIDWLGRMPSGGDPARNVTTVVAALLMCPRNAMHLLGWTEYGQPYRSRWPDLIVRRKPALRDGPGTPD